MKNQSLIYIALSMLMLAYVGCNMEASNHAETKAPEVTPGSDMQIARLSQGDEAAFQRISQAFSERNPGYALSYEHDLESIASTDYPRIVFVQAGATNITLSGGLESKTTVGDIVVLEPGESLKADSLISVLMFRVPESPAAEIPRIIRPDWDPNITDVPGGCATERNAYRRILLTWKQDVGAYLYHALNAHRVRIMDSFSHYHPKRRWI